VHRRDEVVVFLAITVIEEALTTCFEDSFSCECSLSLENTCSFEEIEGIAEVSPTEFCDES
jgi:hypothetical protein